jgi:hypothetical protein
VEIWANIQYENQNLRQIDLYEEDTTKIVTTSAKGYYGEINYVEELDILHVKM